MQTDQLQNTSLKTFRCSQIARRRIVYCFSFTDTNEDSLLYLKWNSINVPQHLFVVWYKAGIRNNMEIWLPLQTRKVVWESAFLLTQAGLMQAYVLLHNVMFCFLHIRNIPNHVRFVPSRLVLGQFSGVLRISSASKIPAMRQTNHLFVRL
jgi:hypothetical protein